MDYLNEHDYSSSSPETIRISEVNPDFDGNWIEHMSQQCSMICPHVLEIPDELFWESAIHPESNGNTEPFTLPVMGSDGNSQQDGPSPCNFCQKKNPHPTETATFNHQSPASLSLPFAMTAYEEDLNFEAIVNPLPSSKLVLQNSPPLSDQLAPTLISDVNTNSEIQKPDTLEESQQTTDQDPPGVGKRENYRGKYRERNRLAAIRSRNKQNELIELLETRNISEEKRRQSLKAEVEDLKRSIQDLKSQLIRYIANTDHPTEPRFRSHSCGHHRCPILDERNPPCTCACIAAHETCWLSVRNTNDGGFSQFFERDQKGHQCYSQHSAN